MESVRRRYLGKVSFADLAINGWRGATVPMDLIDIYIEAYAISWVNCSQIPAALFAMLWGCHAKKGRNSDILKYISYIDIADGPNRGGG
jgi:hypothetical protein